MDPIQSAKSIDVNHDEMRTNAVRFLTREFTEGKDTLQFGVWTGNSMVQIQKLWKKHGFAMNTLWGFDSFEGLPHEANDKVGDRAWVKGAFSSISHFGVSTPEEAMAKLYLVFDPDFKTILVPGFWEQSLTPELASRVKPASYVDIDCDIYSSAVTCLDWLLSNRLVVPGTIIGYHDWKSGGKNGGEQRAHREMLAKHGASAENVWTGCWNSLWRMK